MITSERPLSDGQKTAPYHEQQNGTQHAPLFGLLGQLAECLETASDGVFPSQRASLRTFDLLTQTRWHLPKDGDLYPDGNGGLCVGWEHETRRICLVIHASEEREDYLYWQEGDEYFIETPLTTELLTKWQEWLQATE